MSVLGKRWPSHSGKTVRSWRASPWGGGCDHGSRPPAIALWHTICDRRYNIYHHNRIQACFSASAWQNLHPVLCLIFLGSEKRVDGCFLKRWSEAEKGRCLRRKRRGRCVHCGSFITDCGHIDQVGVDLRPWCCLKVVVALRSYFWLNRIYQRVCNYHIPPKLLYPWKPRQNM